MPKPPARRKRSARFTEIAELAGVSESTVDRVLNERDGVSAAARRKVVEAARKLGVPRVLPAVTHGLLRFDVVIQFERNNHYYRRLNDAVLDAARLLGPRYVVHRHYWNQEEEAAMLRFLDQPPHPRHGLLIVARDTDGVRHALRRLSQANIPIVTLTSDIGGVERRQYTGIDNYVAGRTAAYLLGKLAKGAGHVLLPVTSMAYRAHVDRVAGFMEVMRNSFPQLSVSEPLETLDDDDRAHQVVRQALRTRKGDVVGIYNTGEGSTGVLSALRPIPLAQRPAWITHEATEEHKRLMRAGHIALVLDQDPEAQVLFGFRRLMHACGELDDPVHRPTRFRLVTPENCDFQD